MKLSSNSNQQYSRAFNGPYQGDHLAQIAFPMGGMGAGMICLEGTGGLAKVSLRHHPDLSTRRTVFAAVAFPGMPGAARVLEGPVANWRVRPDFSGEWAGSSFRTLGLPRFAHASFEARFPFATVSLSDEQLPVVVELTGWSPFTPNDADNASLPVVAVEYRFTNRSDAAIEAVFSFHAENLLALVPPSGEPAGGSSNRIVPTAGGFVLEESAAKDRPWEQGQCAVWVDEPGVRVNPAWFCSPATDQLRMLWSEIASCAFEMSEASPRQGSAGASLYVPFTLEAGQSKTFKLNIAWYVPHSKLHQPDFRTSIADGKTEPVSPVGDRYQPWYAGRFGRLEEVMDYWRSQYASLREASQQFSKAFQDSTLPPEVLEAVAANLTILKSPTVLRQTDGRLWGWEGSYEDAGSCYGSSNHVWNYAQAVSHLFPALERTLRETELGENLGQDGFQAIRAALPIRPIGDAREDAWGFPSAADGQLGTLIKSYREWRISGDSPWLERIWPKLRSCLDYCIETWDPEHRGVIEESHINTYDRPLWGADSLCTSLYAGALKAATTMGQALGVNVEKYEALLAKAVTQMETSLFNGEYFFQKTAWKGLRESFPPPATDPMAAVFSQFPAMLELAQKVEPPYQCGTGCLADGLMGTWLSWACGIEEIIDRAKIESHLMAVYRHNMRRNLVGHVNATRAFACGDEGGLLMCTWPKGGRPPLPMIFSDEVWTGVEYEVASHLISMGKVDEGLQIVRACRHRYDGRVRNPFDEVEAGHWYARAMSSYALLQAMSGARFDAVDQVLHLRPPKKGDFRCFISTATGYGTVGVRNGKPSLEVVSGEIPCKKIEFRES